MPGLSIPRRDFLLALSVTSLQSTLNTLSFTGPAYGEEAGKPNLDPSLKMQAKAVRYLIGGENPIPVYSMELWTRNPIRDLEVLLNSEQSIELRMTMLTKVKAAEARIFAQISFKHNLTTEEFGRIEDKFYKFVRLYRDTKKGDEINIALGSDSVRLYQGGKLKGEFPDDATFRKGVLMLWFPREPFDEGIEVLRNKLLAGSKD